MSIHDGHFNSDKSSINAYSKTHAEAPKRIDFPVALLARQKVMEDQAHLYDDKDMALIVAAVANEGVANYAVRYQIAERGSWWVVECLHSGDNVLVDIL